MQGHTVLSPLSCHASLVDVRTSVFSQIRIYQDTFWVGWTFVFVQPVRTFVLHCRGIELIYLCVYFLHLFIIIFIYTVPDKSSDGLHEDKSSAHSKCFLVDSNLWKNGWSYVHQRCLTRQRGSYCMSLHALLRHQFHISCCQGRLCLVLRRATILPSKISFSYILEFIKWNPGEKKILFSF